MQLVKNTLYTFCRYSIHLLAILHASTLLGLIASNLVIWSSLYLFDTYLVRIFKTCLAIIIIVIYCWGYLAYRYDYYYHDDVVYDTYKTLDNTGTFIKEGIAMICCHLDIQSLDNFFNSIYLANGQMMYTVIKYPIVSIFGFR